MQAPITEINKEPFFLFDFDGTVTKIELLPLIGKQLGLEKEITEITQHAISGDIPFEENLKLRVNMLKAVPFKTVQEILLDVPLNLGLLSFIQQNKACCAIVTGNLDAWIAPFINTLGITLFCSEAKVNGDHIEGMNKILRKSEVVSKFSKYFVIAVGDGHNDAEMLEAASIGIAFGGVHSPAKSLMEVCSHATFSEKTLCRFLKQLL